MSERETRARRSDDRARSTTSRRRGKDDPPSRRRERDEPRDETAGRRTREKDESDGRRTHEKAGSDGRRTREKTESKTREPERSTGDAHRTADSGIDARRAAVVAAGYVQEMTGRRPEGLTSLNHTEDGWRIGVEALESKRIPDSTDILAVYQVDLDQDGELLSYRRERRYHRGRVEGEDQ